MQPTQTDRRDASLYDIPWAGTVRRALVLPSPYDPDMLAAFDAATGELILHAGEEFFRLSAVPRSRSRR